MLNDVAISLFTFQLPVADNMMHAAVPEVTSCDEYDELKVTCI